MQGMNFCSGNTRKNTINIDISLSRMVEQGVKKYKTTKLNEIISAICGLLNSGGGRVELYCAEKNASRKHVDDGIRMIEQRIVEMIGTVNLASKIDITQGIDIFVQESSELITVNYNLYLPSKSQVIAVAATEPLEKVKKIMQRKCVENGVSIGSHTKQFLKGKITVLDEAKKVQIKNIKAESSKCITLADRIVGKSNKLTCYISAFANHSGGHIYYGIVDDSGIVEGEKLSQKDKDEIVKKVNKTIIKMVWPQYCDKPKRGVQWDIFFEPVIDDDGNPIPSTFVIILYVAPCLGGVFTEEPESYRIVDGQIQRISFQEWSMIISGIRRSDDQQSSMPLRVSRVTWSSEKNRKVFRMLNEQLIKFRNDKDMDSFNKLGKLAKQRFPESNVELIIMAEKIAVAFKCNHIRKAKSLLDNFSKVLQSSKDCLIFEVRMLQWKSVIELISSPDYRSSYAIAQEGLQKLQLIPLELQTVVFYMDAAMTATLISVYEHEQHAAGFFIAAALQYLDMATRAAKLLENDPPKMSDLQQKLRIYKAWALLGCSITGEVVTMITPSYEDVEVAAGELSSVSESVLRGRFLTCFRKIQYHFAESDLFRRRSEISPEDYIPNLKQAVECATKARDLARKGHFETMVDSANKRLADLTEKLVRHALATRGRPTFRALFALNFE